MRKRKLVTSGVKLLLALLILGILTSCEQNTCKHPSPLVVIVPDSRSIVFLDPNEIYRVKVRSAVLSVGYYLELAELENDLKAGRLKRVEP